MVSDRYVVVDMDSIEDVNREDGEIISVTLSVVAEPFDDPHEAGFKARDNWSYEFVEVEL